MNRQVGAVEAVITGAGERLAKTGETLAEGIGRQVERIETSAAHPPASASTWAA